MAQSVERLPMEREVSCLSLAKTWLQVCGRDWLGRHVGCQEVGWCHTRGEFQGMCNTYASAKCE